jgi:hypothetical protein
MLLFFLCCLEHRDLKGGGGGGGRGCGCGRVEHACYSCIYNNRFNPTPYPSHLQVPVAWKRCMYTVVATLIKTTASRLQQWTLLLVCWHFVGFYGTYCEEFSSCLTNPCGDHGSCTPLPQSMQDGDDDLDYECQCDPSWWGLQCQYPDSCSLDVCHNGATCQNVPPNQFRWSKSNHISIISHGEII